MSDPAWPVLADSMTVGGAPEPWRQCGFDVAEDGHLGLPVGPGLVIDPTRPAGLHGWSFRGLHTDAPADIDGLPLLPPTPTPVLASGRGDHPNGAQSIDHVVVDTDSLDRTCAAINAALGAPLKRVRELGVARQGFHRLDTFVIEVVERADRGADPPGARFWGVTFTVTDPDAAAALLGPDRCGAVKDAVQPGRRITTLRREAGLGFPVAFISPRPTAGR